MLQRDKGECWSRRAWRENSGVVESCCVRPWSSDKFGRLDVEQRRTGTATVGVERRVVSDNAATDGGRWRSARSVDASRGECWWTGAGGGGRDAQSFLRCQTVLHVV